MVKSTNGWNIRICPNAEKKYIVDLLVRNHRQICNYIFVVGQPYIYEYICTYWHTHSNTWLYRLFAVNFCNKLGAPQTLPSSFAPADDDCGDERIERSKTNFARTCDGHRRERTQGMRNYDEWLDVVRVYSLCSVVWVRWFLFVRAVAFVGWLWVLTSEQAQWLTNWVCS